MGFRYLLNQRCFSGSHARLLKVGRRYGAIYNSQPDGLIIWVC